MTNVVEHPAMEPSRTPPYNLAAEMQLIGAVLSDNRAYDLATDRVPLRAAHFADPAHRVIWQTIAGMVDQGRAASTVTLKNLLEHNNELIDVGGTAYLSQLANAVMIVDNAGDLAAVIHEAHVRRGLIEAAEFLIEHAYAKTDQPASSLLADHSTVLDLLIDARRTGRGGMIDDIVRGNIAAIEEAHRTGVRPGVPTGLKALDAIIGGMMPGLVTGICGRPAMGKSSMCTTIAVNQAMAGSKVLYLTWEDTALVMGHRILSRQTSVPVTNILRNELHDDDVRALAAAPNLLDGSIPLRIEECHGRTVAEVRNLIRSVKRQMGGLDVLYIDHLTKIPGPGTNDTERTTFNSNAVANLAPDMGVALGLVVQMNRANEQRENKRPTLPDLRSSGAIEQDLRAAIGVYREAYYMLQGKPQRKAGEGSASYHNRTLEWEANYNDAKSKAELIIMKQSHGAEGVAHVQFDGPTTSFRD